MLHVNSEDKAKLITPLFSSNQWYKAAVGGLVLIIAWGVFIYIRQIVLGLGETGMDRPAYWGIYMVNFIFFIGISHAGTLISAILRVTGAEWRRPITRVAEAITAFALIVGTLQIIFDMGRPDRLVFTLLYGRLQSPILWDVVSVTTYFLGSVTYLYLPVIPDFLKLREIELYIILWLEQAFDINDWCQRFFNGRKERIENDIPVIDIDFTRFC